MPPHIFEAAYLDLTLRKLEIYCVCWRPEDADAKRTILRVSGSLSV